MRSQYDQDFYAWVTENASLLRQGQLNKIDIENVAEELEAMGRSEKRGLVSHLSVLIAHLMKWQFQEKLRSKSWKITIERQRIEINDVLEENPSLKYQIQEIMPKAYKYALNILKEETPLDSSFLPKECPYTFPQMIDEEFFPN